MKPEDLLVLSRDLARRETGKPKSVSLRRAVSGSYYALFHALARLCADSLVGRKPWAIYTPVYRALDHRRALAALVAHGPSITAVAATFKALQEARHEADYSPEPFKPDRRDTMDLIDSAERAVTALDALTSDEKLALAIRLVVKPR